jgi:succinate dehydrogenase / fumarate reductase, membrane anchor subunit
MADLSTPLRRARGLGSAKHGVGHFIGQRVSAAALVILICWAFSQAPGLAKGGFDGARVWLASPVNAALASLLALTGFYHAQLGMQVIVEDYIGRPLTRTCLLILNAFVAWVAAAVAVISLLKVAFGGGA